MVQLYMQMGQAPPEPPEVYGMINQVLQSQAYQVQSVQITEESPIPEEATTLVVLAPKSLEERQLYEINRFVKRGGRLVIATQDYEFNYSPSRQGGFNYTPTPQQSNLDPLLAAWGLAVSDGILMDGNSEVLGIPSERNLGGMRVPVTEPVQAPIQIKVTSNQFNEDTSIANGLGGLLYLWGSRLQIDEELLANSDVRSEVLFTTSSEAWEADFVPGPLAPTALIQNPDQMVGRVPLAVLLKGEIPNAWADGMIPAWANTPDSLRTDEPVEEFVPVESAIVVVGCSKMFEDSFLQMVPGNAMLLLNAVDALTLGDDLIEIRAKVTTQRSLSPMSDKARLLIKLIVVGLVPGLVAAFGVFRQLRRRREEAVFLAAQGGH
jgi:ABC-2 type transport system permease protein